MFRSIVLGNLYRFTTSNPHPYILDCGANVGVASRYFATLYPHAEIVAFEPDARIHELLTANLRGFSGVKVVNAALGSHDGEVTFVSEGADAGFVNLDDSAMVEAYMGAGSLNRTTPIIAMTANAFDEDRQACLDAGMNDHVSKPVAPKVPYETLLAWLEMRGD